MVTDGNGSLHSICNDTVACYCVMVAAEAGQGADVQLCLE